MLINNIYSSKDNVNAPFSRFYLLKKSFFDKNSAKAEIVMVGDSLTMGAEWSELFPTISIANRGGSSDTSRGILNRMDSIYSTKPKKAFVMLGFNDIAKNYSVKYIFNNYKEILILLKSHGIEPYIQSTLLVSGRWSWLNEKISILNNQLTKLAKENNYVFIDLNKALAIDGKLNQAFTNDDLHLNGDGYSVWKQEISKYIQ